MLIAIIETNPNLDLLEIFEEFLYKYGLNFNPEKWGVYLNDKWYFSFLNLIKIKARLLLWILILKIVVH
jgi:hypothetical protein